MRHRFKHNGRALQTFRGISGKMKPKAWTLLFAQFIRP